VKQPPADEILEASWDTQMDALRSAWRQFPAELEDEQIVAAWRTRLNAMNDVMMQMRRHHHWARGPVDLLSICGLQRRETAHSAALQRLNGQD